MFTTWHLAASFQKAWFIHSILRASYMINPHMELVPLLRNFLCTVIKFSKNLIQGLNKYNAVVDAENKTNNKDKLGFSPNSPI